MKESLKQFLKKPLEDCLTGFLKKLLMKPFKIFKRNFLKFSGGFLYKIPESIFEIISEAIPGKTHFELLQISPQIIEIRKWKTIFRNF